MFSNILQTSILQIFSKLIYFESAKCSQNILPMIFLSQDLPCQKFSKHSWNKCSSNILQINVAQVLTCQIISKLSCKSPEKFHQDHSSPIPAYTISIMIVFQNLKILKHENVFFLVNMKSAKMTIWGFINPV